MVFFGEIYALRLWFGGDWSGGSTLRRERSNHASMGTDVVAARGGVEVFPLHWDDMYDNDVPLIDAIYDALDTRKPKQDNGLNKALEEAVSRAASIFREPPTASQLKSVAAELLKNEGVEFEAAQLDHAATTYRMANNDHNKAPSPKP